MESIAIAYVLNCKKEKMRTLAPEMVSERNSLQSEIFRLQDLYEQALENY